MLIYSLEDYSNSGDLLGSFKRHATTCKQAQEAEDGPLNAFTGQKLSNKYMKILKTRRDLPVHQQRYAQPHILAFPL
jgi:pre-mRNA-splicing factor ATP-dependent RNA helicase DHX15/PRP43